MLTGHGTAVSVSVVAELRRDWASEVEALVDLLETYYLVPDIAARVGRRLRERLAAGAYAGLDDDRSFAQAVTDDAIAVSGDLHLRLRYSVAELAIATGTVVPDSGRRPTEARLNGHGFVRVERLPGNIGHLDIRRFYPASMSRPAAVAAMHLVADTDVLLVDLRRCGGGEPDMVALVCSFLFDDPMPLSALHFPAEDRTLEFATHPVPEPTFGGHKPLILVTSAESISAAEGMTYDLQQHGRATVVGERTAGAANFDYRYRVGPHLMFSVPSGYPVNPVTGHNWEARGVAPDIAVTAASAWAVAYRLALEHALTLGFDGHRQAVYDEAQRALAELDAMGADGSRTA